LKPGKILYREALYSYLNSCPTEMSPGTLCTGVENTRSRSSLHYLARNPVFPPIWGLRMYDPGGRVSPYLKSSKGFNAKSVLPKSDSNGRYHALPIPKFVSTHVKKVLGSYPEEWALWYWVRQHTVEGILLTPIISFELEEYDTCFNHVEYCFLTMPDCWKTWSSKRDSCQYYSIIQKQENPFFLNAEPVRLNDRSYKETPFVEIPRNFFYQSSYDICRPISVPNQETPDNLRPVYALLYDDIGTVLFLRRRYCEAVRDLDEPDILNARIIRSDIYLYSHSSSSMESSVQKPCHLYRLRVP